MPLFAKCFNSDCLYYGQYQEADGACKDCGAPLHVRGVAPVVEDYMFIVSCRGPSPVVIPIRDAANKDEAAAMALREIGRLGYEPNQFRVDRVYGPEDSPRLQNELPR